MASTIPPDVIPATSEQHCPNPAAAIVDIPNVTPNVESMASPAVIITTLSIIPNPIMGIPARNATIRSCSVVGGCITSTATATASNGGDEDDDNF